MLLLKWNADKNEWLKRERGVGFDEIAVRIHSGAVLEVVDHPNQTRYPGQKIFIVEHDNYVYLVPYVEEEKDILFLKTIVPSRKYTKGYLRSDPNAQT